MQADFKGQFTKQSYTLLNESWTITLESQMGELKSEVNFDKLSKQNE